MGEGEARDLLDILCVRGVGHDAVMGGGTLSGEVWWEETGTLVLADTTERLSPPDHPRLLSTPQSGELILSLYLWINN